MKTTFNNFKQFVSNMIQALYRAYDTIGELKRENNSLLQIIKELKNKVSGYEKIDRIKTRQINDLEEENRNLTYDNHKLSESNNHLKEKNKSLNRQLNKISNSIQIQDNQIK